MYTFSSASHLVGGNLRYEFIGVQSNGDHRYKIIMNYFLNCDNTANGTWQNPTLLGFQNDPAKATVTIGIYGHDDLLNVIPSQATSYPKWGQGILNVESVAPIPLGNPSGCNVGSSTCVYKVVYSSIVDLNNNAGNANGGYHITHERCCRNNTIQNINGPGGTGMTYYAWIPPVTFSNTSPEFTDDPLPFICQGDSTTVLNTAIDVDGDELIFSYVSPLDGNFTGGGNWNPQNYPATYQIPIGEVTYSGGYNYQSPFGIGGVYNIVASNGLTTYYCNTVGQFVVAVLIKEYREIFGQVVLYGITTREVQLIVTNCPPNEPPQINPNAGTTSSNHTIEEGDSLCFDFGYYDPSSPPDQLTLTASGQIFDQNIINPSATIQSPVSSNLTGQDTVNSRFCWDTDCGQSQNLPYIFSVSVTDQGCPPKTANSVYEITVTPTAPAANIYGDLIFCQNSITTYTTDNNPSISSYSWNVVNNGTIIQNFGDSVQVLWTSPGTGTIELRAVNSHGCESTPISMNATITPAPTVDAGNDVDLCIGDSALLIGSTTANPGYISSWQSTGPISTPNNLQTYVNPTDTTNYILLVDIGGGCLGIDSVTVNVAIADVDAGIDETICLGDSVNLIASSSAANFSWTPNSFIDQPNNFSTNAWPNASTQYIVEATTTNGCTDKDTVVVFVSPLPGSSATFVLNGSATDLGNNEYLLTNQINWDTGAVWNQTLVNLNQPFHFDIDLYFGTKDANGADGIAFGLQQLSNQLLMAGGGIGYQGITPSFFVEFDTWQNSIYNDISNDHIAVQKDGDIDHNSVNNLFPVQSLGNGNIEDGLWHNCIFDWDPTNFNFTVEFDGIQVVNMNYDIVNNVFGGTSATYWGFTSSTGGSNNEQKIRYNTVTFFNEIIDQEICSEDTISISAPVDGDTYLWEPNNFINDNSLQTPIFDPDITTIYTFTATNSFGCFIKDTFEIKVNSLPDVIAGNNQDICIGDSAILSSNGNAISYFWDNGVNDGVTFEVLNTLDYILTGISSDGCINTDTVTINALAVPNTFNGEADGYINLCINDSVQLQGQGADIYLWTPSTFLSDPNIATPWATPSTPTQYILTGSLPNGCSNTDTLQIDVNPLPVLSTGPDQIICEGDSIQIEAFGGISFNWITTDSINDPSISNPTVWPTVTTTYKVLVSDLNTCEDTAEVTVLVNPKPTIEAGPEQNICIGDSTSVIASGTAINYSWNNGISDGVLFQVNQTQNYILSGTDANNCTNTDTVTVNAIPLPIIDAGNDLTICSGDSIQLNASGGDVYIWTPNTAISDNNISNPFVNPIIDIQYFLNGTDSNGCSNIDSIGITIDVLPAITISNDTAICIGDTINISANGGVNYEWLNLDFINNTTISNPNIWPNASSTYPVKVTGGNNCFDTAEINITVNPLPTIFAGNEQNICFGDSTFLIASGSANSYSWDNGVLDGVSFQVNQTLDYILTGIDLNSCINSDTVTINSLDLPTIDAGSAQTICFGDSAQIIASGGTTYLWTPNINITDNTIENPFVFPSTDTNYFVIGTDTNGCQNNDSVSISINSLPTIVISNDTSICIGDTISINASGGIQYEWLNTDSINNTLIANPDIWPSATSIYDVLVTNSNNCKDTAQINITVNNLPNIILSTDVDLCFGDTTQITVSGANNYQWSPNNNISSISSNSPELWPNDTTNYTVIGTDINQCSSSDSISINVLNLPNADAGADLWICPGGSISLNASGGTSYNWSPDSTLNNGSSQNPIASPVNDETYIVTVTDINNCFNTDTLFLAVEQNVPTDAGGINDTLNICEGLSQVLGASPTSPNGSTYQWNPTSTLTSPNSSNPIAQPITPSWYTVQTNNDTCSGVDSVFVNFFPSLVASSGSNQQICIGDSTTIVASGGNTYNWSPVLNASGDTILQNDSIFNPQVFPIDTTTFYVTITDTNGCIKTDSTVIIVNPLPNFDLGANTSLCLNDSLNLLASGGNNYIWTPNYNITNTSIANPIVFNFVDTTYFVTVTDTNSCINSDSINISVNTLPTVNASANDTVICYGSNTLLIGTGALSYVWSPTDSLSNPNIPFPSANPDTSTLFTLIGTDANGCGGIDSVNITVLPLPIVDAGEDSIICPGLSVQFNGSGGSSYQWLNPINLNNFLIADPVATPDTITSYILQATDSNGCINTDTAIIFLHEPANANAGFNLSICLDESVLLTATGGVSYNWEPSSFVNRPDTSIVLATPNDDMEFIVEVIDTNGCIDFDTIQVQVFIANSIGDTIICKGDSVQADIFGDPGVEFSWTPTNGVSDSSIFNPYLSPMNTTTYLLDITNASGCVITDSITVEVPDPIASFDTTLQAGCDGVVVNYINTSSSDLNINWIFSNGESSILNEVEKEFKFDEDYSATLNVEDQYGCTNSVTVTGTSLSFNDYFSIYKPNVFTPNGDGENDEFIIDVPGKLYECTDLVIYNRWGQIQFISTGNNIRWDGRNNVGQISPNGTYFYTLTIKNKEYGGSLNLYR
ncbi:MAG: lectin-like domain-containing protein [Parvicellaceae bacterium]